MHGSQTILFANILIFFLFFSLSFLFHVNFCYTGREKGKEIVPPFLFLDLIRLQILPLCSCSFPENTKIHTHEPVFIVFGFSYTTEGSYLVIHIVFCLFLTYFSCFLSVQCVWVVVSRPILSLLGFLAFFQHFFSFLCPGDQMRKDNESIIGLQDVQNRRKREENTIVINRYDNLVVGISE